MTSAAEETRYVYVFTRIDMPVQDQVCQAIHAGIEAGAQYADKNTKPHLAFCTVPDVAELVKIEETCQKRNIAYVLIDEPDDNLGFTAIATEPIAKSQGKYFMQYPLWRPIRMTISAGDLGCI
jgi:siroheme synthase (precorrin-2 oxidase/ferrochelatase)